MSAADLRAMLAADQVTHVPGVYDPASAALAVRAGHRAVHLSGRGGLGHHARPARPRLHAGHPDRGPGGCAAPGARRRAAAGGRGHRLRQPGPRGVDGARLPAGRDQRAAPRRRRGRRAGGRPDRRAGRAGAAGHAGRAGRWGQPCRDDRAVPGVCGRRRGRGPSGGCPGADDLGRLRAELPGVPLVVSRPRPGPAAAA